MRIRQQFLQAFRTKDKITRDEARQHMQCFKKALYYRLQRLETDRIIHVVGNTITLTDYGRTLVEVYEEREQRQDEVAIAHLRRPCGQAMKKCFMSSGCYLRDICSAPKQ